jgi:hypothetical protein
LAIYSKATLTDAANIVPSLPSSAQSKQHARFDSTGRVQVDVYFDCTLKPPTQALGAAGLVINTWVKVPPFCGVEGWALPKVLPTIASVTGVKSIKLPVYARHHAASAKSPSRPRGAPPSAIDYEGVTVMRADLYSQQTGGNGSGVSVAIMSGDATSLSMIQSRGELPGNVTIIPSGGAAANPTDEGTVMLEEVYAVAPGASLAFCGPQTQMQYVGCLQQIASARMNIAADDIGWEVDDLMSSNSQFALGVHSVLTANPNLTLFSAAGNDNQSYWQGSYSPVSFTFKGSPSITCSANGQVDNYLQNFGSQPYETLTVFTTISNPLYLQWADPFGQNVSNFDLYVLDGSFNVLACIPGAGSPETYNALFNASFTPGTYYLLVGTTDQSFSGKFLKLDAHGDGGSALSVTSTGSVDSPQKLVR